MSISYKYESLKPLKQKGQDEYEPDQEQILEYAIYIGVILPGQEHLLQLAKQGVKALLPKNWEACQAMDGELVYRNTVTKIVQQQHPLDNFYRQKVIRLREEYKNYVQQEEQQKLSDLNTIVEQKSEERSLSGSQQKNMSAAQRAQTNLSFQFKEQNSYELNRAIMVENSKQLIPVQKQQKILAQISSFALKSKSNQQKKQDIKSDIRYKKSNQIETLKQKLEMLKMQQKLSSQLLIELQRNNNTMVQKIKEKRNPKNNVQIF